MEEATFLTKEYIQEMIPNKGEILKYTIENCVPEGENHTSVLVRINITYKGCENNSFCVIIKSSPTALLIKKIDDEMKLFVKEMEVYEEILPAMYQIMRNSSTLSPKIYKIVKGEERNVIVMEDLKASGYKMIDRRMGLNLEQSFMVLKKLAMFHASSAIASQKQPKLFEKFTDGIFCKLDFIKIWIARGFQTIAERLSSWPGYECYAAKVAKLSPEGIFQKLYGSTAKSDMMNVLNHGDPWTNNMMFLYDSNGQLKDLKMVDFQMIIFTSPVIDLHYFLTVSLEYEVLRDHFHLLLDYYYANLLGAFVECKHPLDKVPTREQFLNEFKERSFYGLVCIMTMLALFRAPRCENGTFEEFVRDKEQGGFRDKCFSNKEFVQSAKLLVEYYDKMGALD